MSESRSATYVGQLKAIFSESVHNLQSALSRFIADFVSGVSEVEINPLAVLEQGSGCLALDAVVVTKRGDRCEIGE